MDIASLFLQGLLVYELRKGCGPVDTIPPSPVPLSTYGLVLDDNRIQVKGSFPTLRDKEIKPMTVSSPAIYEAWPNSEDPEIIIRHRVTMTIEEYSWSREEVSKAKKHYVPDPVFPLPRSCLQLQFWYHIEVVKVKPSVSYELLADGIILNPKNTPIKRKERMEAEKEKGHKPTPPLSTMWKVVYYDGNLLSWKANEIAGKRVIPTSFETVLYLVTTENSTQWGLDPKMQCIPVRVVVPEEVQLLYGFFKKHRPDAAEEFNKLYGESIFLNNRYTDEDIEKFRQQAFQLGW